jgi:multiple sugar transport system ATP-binding protein
MAAIEMKNIVKKYGDGFPAVNDISIDVADGEFMILVGPSGCGKSTLLRMIVGLEDITSGDMVIGGDRVNDLAPRDRNLSMVFQNYALYPHMTVADNMAFALKMAKVPAAERQKRVKDAAEMLGLTEFLDRKPKALSGGQRQRVAMGRAIVREPKVFLMDEPLSNLDAKLRVQTRTQIAALQRRLGVTTVYVTHDQVEAMTMGDRVAVLKDGVLQQVDTPLRLYQHPANVFVAGFIGSPAMNFATVTMTNGNGRVVAKNAGLEIEVPGREAERLLAHVGRQVTLGIRPEDLHVARDGDPAGLTFNSKVEVVEQLGSEILLDVRVGDSSMVASVEPTTRVKVQETMRLAINPERLHFFDASTEAAI